MATYAILLFLSVTLVYSAVIEKDGAHQRIVRCDTCPRDQRDYPPPPPWFPPPFPYPPPHFRHPHYPPPYFRTQQWSGLANNADGNPQGVYSGAAAEAVGARQPSGQAFSVASAQNGYGTPGTNSDKIQNYNDNHFDGSKGYGSLSKAESSSLSGQNGIGYQQGAQQQAHGSNDLQHQNSAAAQSSAQSAASSSGYGQGPGSQFQPQNQNQQQIKSNHGATGYNSGTNYDTKGKYTDVGQSQSYGHENGYKTNEENAQSVKDSLHLASQGLQSAQQTGCSTCDDKGSYALSNAKSNSGSAIALSVSG